MKTIPVNYQLLYSPSVRVFCMCDARTTPQHRLHRWRILNAVALGIILDIDDWLFDALATTPGRHLVHQLDALPMPALPRIRGADAKSVSWRMLPPCRPLKYVEAIVYPINVTI